MIIFLLHLLSVNSLTKTKFYYFLEKKDTLLIKIK